MFLKIRTVANDDYIINVDKIICVREEVTEEGTTNWIFLEGATGEDCSCFQVDGTLFDLIATLQHNGIKFVS